MVMTPNVVVAVGILAELARIERSLDRICKRITIDSGPSAHTAQNTRFRPAAFA